jgi:hypothetical protein
MGNEWRVFVLSTSIDTCRVTDRETSSTASSPRVFPVGFSLTSSVIRGGCRVVANVAKVGRPALPHARTPAAHPPRTGVQVGSSAAAVWTRRRPRQDHPAIMPRTRSRARCEQVNCLLLGLLDDHLLISCAASLGVKGLGRLARVCNRFCAAEGEPIPEAAARLAVARYSQGERDKAPHRGEAWLRITHELERLARPLAWTRFRTQRSTRSSARG